MASVTAVFLALLSHILMEDPMYIKAPKNNCSPAPDVAKWLFMFSAALITRDAENVVSKYVCGPKILQIFLQFHVTTLLLEISRSVLWCNIERSVHVFFQWILGDAAYNYFYGDTIFQCLITLMSLMIFGSVMETTGTLCVLQTKLQKIMRLFPKKNSPQCITTLLPPDDDDDSDDPDDIFWRETQSRGRRTSSGRDRGGLRRRR